MVACARCKLEMHLSQLTGVLISRWNAVSDSRNDQVIHEYCGDQGEFQLTERNSST